MKALLLAAGRGTRISRYLSGNPKCTVDIGGEKLIRYTVSMLRRHGVTDIALVLGYRAGTIRQVLRDFDVKYFVNPFYDVTNSIASAWFARDFLTEWDDTVIMNADVYLDESLLCQILSSSSSPVMFADNSRREEADYKFRYSNGRLEKYGKELTGEDISGEYIGVGRFSREFMPTFVSQMDRMIARQQHGVWWENVLYSMIPATDVFVEEIGGQFWAEVDYIEDYQRILAHRGISTLPQNPRL